MTDVQTAPTAQPSVFEAMPSVQGLDISNTLARATGTALHVERDAGYLLVCRTLLGTCTREEWDRPEHRRLAIADAWRQVERGIRVEDEELVSPAPVTLYRDRRTGRVVCADISLPGRPQRLVTPEGRPAVATAADLALTYRVDRTSFAVWAIGPLPHLELDMRAAKTPDQDRDIQYLRHLNADTRRLVDGALSPSEWAPEANTVADGHLVDYQLRGVFRRREYRQLVSKQTGEASGLLLSDGYHEILPEVTAAPTTEAALDALLDAD